MFDEWHFQLILWLNKVIDSLIFPIFYFINVFLLIFSVFYYDFSSDFFL